MARSIWSITPAPRSSGTRDRLIDAAACLFYSEGFHAVGLDRVLEEVGVTKTTFYNHFPSKDDLIVAVLEDRDRRDMDSLLAAMQRTGDSPRDRILVLFDVIDAWFHDPGFNGCLFINAAVQFPNRNDPVHQAARKHAENLERAVRELGAAGRAADPVALARQIAMLVTAAITTRHAAGDLSAASTVRAMATVLLDRQLAPPR